MSDINTNENIRLPPKWIELNLSKKECSTFLAVPNDSTLCQCGRRKIDHGDFVKLQHNPVHWSPNLHTRSFSTDAYGTILFEGEHHHNKAHYARLSFDTNPHMLIQLMHYVWGYPMPKLVISVRGGSTNFDLSPRLGKIFQTGIIKAAKSTSAWVLSGGLNTGVAKHLGQALVNERWIGAMKRQHIVSVGIAPWGMCEHRDELIGRNKERVYSPLEHAGSKFLHLNPRHANFLLVDNGSIGKFGGENYLRLRFEKCIASYPSSPHRGCGIPVVVIVIEGGFHTLRMITEYLYSDPPIPVVIFAGTGRSADLVAWTHKKFRTHEELESHRESVYKRIANVFHVGEEDCAIIFKELRGIWKRKTLITVYNPNSPTEEEFDTAILASIFRSQHWSPMHQLSLALVWDRVDIAQAEVFVYGREWSRDHLEQAMMEALVSNRLEFVNLLLEHGLNMQSFLTASRLEALYSVEHQVVVMVGLLMEFAKMSRYKRNKKASQERNFTLHDIGVAMNHMMGHIYRSPYVHMLPKIHENPGATLDDQEVRSQIFAQPFDDLFLWAVMTKRHELAKLLWLHGHGALAKALVAVKLNKFIAKELKSMMTTLGSEFESNAEEWETMSLTLLDLCYRQNCKMARQLLTMELQNWSQQTCLTLAVIADHRMFLGHACCQILLADLWMGALSIKSNVTLKIFFGILCPPLIFFLDYKSTEELRLLPHQEKGQHLPFFEDRDSHDDAGMIQDIAVYQDQRLPESDTTMIASKSLRSVTSVFRNRLKSSVPAVGKVTDLSLVVSKLEFGKPSGKGLIATQSKAVASPHLAGSGVIGNTSNDIVAVDGIKRKQEKDGQRRVKGESQKFMEHQMDQSQSLGAFLGMKRGNLFNSFVTTHQSLGPIQKFIEFQKAPVTNFFRHAIAYLVFIIALAYVILYPQNPYSLGWVEIYIICSLSSLGLECIREFLFIDAVSFSKKVARMSENVWAVADFIVVIIFLIGVSFRCQPQYFEYGMLTYRTTSIYWNMRLYKYLGVHRFVGPKIFMMAKMFTHMACFSAIILVVIVSFGISREAIRYPNSYPTWNQLAEAFLEPYVMMFGEVDSDDVLPQCGNKTGDSCPMGLWLIPVFWVVYMMVSNILIVNVLIAVFNGIYAEIDAQAVEVWMFQRFTFVMEFEQKPVLPPPFIIICHLLYASRFIWNKCVRFACEEELLEQNLMDEDKILHVMKQNDHNLKSFLSPGEQHMVYDFEEENLDMLRPTMFQREPSSSAANQLSESGIGLRTAGFSAYEKSGFQQLKTVLQDIYAEMEGQKAKIDKLIEYWEMDLETLDDNDDVGNNDSFLKVSGESVPISTISTRSEIYRPPPHRQK